MRILSRWSTAPVLPTPKDNQPTAHRASWAAPVRVARDIAPRLAGLLRPISTGIAKSKAARKDRPFTLRYGIEIEMLGVTLQQAAEVVSARMPGSRIVAIEEKANKGDFNVVESNGRVWEVKHDYPNLVELATPILKTRADLELVKTMAQALNKAGAQTPEHAGLHVHIEGAPFSARNATHVLSFISQHEWHLLDTLGIHRTRRGECKPLERFPVDRLAISPPRSRSEFIRNYANREWAGKQRGVNMRNFHKEDGTIEFRYFNATLDADELELCHEFVMAVAHRALKRGGRPSPGDALRNRSPQEMCAELALSTESEAALLNNATSDTTEAA